MSLTTPIFRIQLPVTVKDKFQIYSSLAFMIVVVLIGLPMWWKTTEVYRSTLPDSNIKSLDSHKISITLNIYICTADIERYNYLIKGIKSNIMYEGIFLINFVYVDTKFTNVKTPAALDKLIKQKENVKPGDFIFIEWKNQTDEVIVTSERTAFISEKVSARTISLLLSLNILKLQEILKILNEDNSNRLHGTPILNQYDVIISVFNSDPELMDVKWNIKEAAQIYLDPFLNIINFNSNYTLKTQFKYQVPLKNELRQIKYESKLGRHYILSESELPHIITLIEKNLGSITSDNPIINLIVYIPPCEVSPLNIHRNNKELINSLNRTIESFASPKWGAVIINNPSMEFCKKKQELKNKISFVVDSKEVMQSLLFQMQKFYGINNHVNIEGIKFAEVESVYPYEWQFDAYIRRITVSYILTTVRTLQSLVQLLESISYIVINDDVGISINVAYENIISAKSFLIEGNLMEAMKYAQKGFLSSERAFFDASLLAQLYFPDEQKYAIYIPLFLPIMVPVVTSLIMIIKWYIRPKEL